MEDTERKTSVSRSEDTGHRNRPPSPPPIKSSKYSRSPSPGRRRPRTPPSREYSRSFDRDRRRNFSPSHRRNRSRSPEFNRNRDRRSRSTSRGRRMYSPRGGRRRPRTPPVPAPPAINHVPAYVPQPVFGDQYQGYCGYVPTGYNNSTTVVNSTFDPSYMVPNNPYMAPGANYGAPPPPVLNPDYIQQQPQWAPPQQQQQMMAEPMKPQDDGRLAFITIIDWSAEILLIQKTLHRSILSRGPRDAATEGDTAQATR